VVEYNTKYQEFQKNFDSLSDAVKQLKEKELMELQQRLTAFQQAAGADIQKKSAELMEPIIEKANKAVQEVAKAGGYAVILETGSMVYYDEATVKDITPEVKTKLGIDPNAKPAQMQPQQ
jgi:outer membrane protein